VYGDVIRVKILYNRKDSALVQYSSPPGADLASQHLNGITFYGKRMKVSYSKYQNVAPPKDSAVENDTLTKDFTNHPLHRFKVIWANFSFF
jgi:RNA recognition motif-containing protein